MTSRLQKWSALRDAAAKALLMSVAYGAFLVKRAISQTLPARVAIGISGDLTDALRQATTGLSRWLEADYGLSTPELASLLGASMRYDVADLVGTQVSIVAKMPKALRQVARAAR